VATGYALLGAAHLAMIWILASVMWAGSFKTLRRDAMFASDSFTTLGTLAGTHLAMAALSYRFVQRPSGIRVVAIAGATLIFAATLYGAVTGVLFWVRGRLPVDFPSGALALTIVRPFIYGWLAYELVRLRRTSNYRLERP
jgi:hypothetical protein